MTRDITLDMPSMGETCKNLYWALKMEKVPREYVYFLRSELMRGYR